MSILSMLVMPTLTLSLKFTNPKLYTKMEESIFNSLLKDEFTQKDHLTLYNEIFHEFQTPKSQRKEGVSELDGLYAQFKKTVDTFFEQISQLNLNSGRRLVAQVHKNITEESQEEDRVCYSSEEMEICEEEKEEIFVEETEKNIMRICDNTYLESFLFEIENALIFSSRLTHTCIILARRFSHGNVNIFGYFLQNCLNRWLNQVNSSVLNQCFKVDSERFYFKYKCFWKFYELYGTDLSDISKYEEKKYL